MSSPFNSRQQTPQREREREGNCSSNSGQVSLSRCLILNNSRELIQSSFSRLWEGTVYCIYLITVLPFVVRAQLDSCLITFKSKGGTWNLNVFRDSGINFQGFELWQPTWKNTRSKCLTFMTVYERCQLAAALSTKHWGRVFSMLVKQKNPKDLQDPMWTFSTVTSRNMTDVSQHIHGAFLLIGSLISSGSVLWWNRSCILHVLPH